MLSIKDVYSILSNNLGFTIIELWLLPANFEIKSFIIYMKVLNIDENYLWLTLCYIAETSVQ